MTISEANSPAAENIVRIIGEKGLKYKHVAEKAGYSKNDLCAMLKGRKIIKACDVVRLTKALGVCADDVFLDIK